MFPGIYHDLDHFLLLNLREYMQFSPIKLLLAFESLCGEDTIFFFKKRLAQFPGSCYHRVLLVATHFLLGVQSRCLPPTELNYMLSS